MMRLGAQPLTAEAFAPFGEVLEAPARPGRNYIEGALANLRPQALPSLSFTLKQPLPALPLRSTTMERHRFSSQSFIPQQAGRWLAIVAPHAAAGGPEMREARAFLCAPHQGVTYGADVWHHPFTVLDQEARFAIVMWRTGRPGDDEFVAVPEFEVTP